MKRCIRYCAGTSEYGQWFPRGGDMGIITGCADTDWASNKNDRKSVVHGQVYVGGCCLLSYVRGQLMQAHSSTEAEFYGQVSVAVEMILLRRVFEWLGYPMRMELESDST